MVLLDTCNMWNYYPILTKVDRTFCSLHSLFSSALTNESWLQVEVLCGGKVVNQGMTLHDLADCWLEKGPKSRMRSSVGSPATGFMVTLFYRRPDVDVSSSPAPPQPDTESCHSWCRALLRFWTICDWLHSLGCQPLIDLRIGSNLCEAQATPIH